MSSFGRDAAPAPARLTHDEAEGLISARLDGPIDPAANRALLAHLATCPTCRAFADQMESMSQGLRNLPHLPASPTVSRQVRERLAGGQPWWSKFTLAAGGRFGGMQAAATMLILLGVVATVLIIQMVGEEGGGKGNVPTTIVPPTVSTATVAPTQTVTPTSDDQSLAQNVSPTRTPKPPTPTATATKVNVQVTVQPTETPTETIQVAEAPTDTPEPTETETAAPTTTPRPSRTPRATEEPSEEPTDEPTDTPTEAPTETPRPTETSTPEPEPTDTPEPTETATEEPSATPTETETPTEAPTDTPEPTATRTPRPTRTPKPTREPEPTETPTITPTVGIVQSQNTPEGGEQPEETPDQTEPTAKPTETPTEESTQIQVAEQPTICPLGCENPTEGPTDETVEPTPEDGTGADGEVSPTPEEPEPTETPEPTEEPTEEPAGPLASAEVVAEFPQGAGVGNGFRYNPAYGLFALDLGGQIVVIDEAGGFVTSLQGSSPVWSPKGSILLYQGNGEVMTWDTETGATNSITAVTRGDQDVVDYAAGWTVQDGNSILLYVRTYPDNPNGAELHRSDWKGENDQVLGSGGLPPIVAGPVATDSGVWVLIDQGWVGIGGDDSVTRPIANPFGGISGLVASPGRTLVAYVAGDQLVVASAADPSQPYGAPIPYGGGGFAFHPNGEQVVVADGSGLSIYAIDGTLVGRLDGVAASAPGWGGAGIYFVAPGETATLYRTSPDQFAPA